MALAKLIRRALHPPLPGTPEAAAFEREYAQVRGRFGVSPNSTSAEDEDDEEEQERLLQLYYRMREHQARNAAILRSATQSRAPRYMTDGDGQDQDE